MKGSLPICVLLCSVAVSSAWDLKPDPPAEKPWAVKVDLNLPLADRNDRIMFADAGGPFVLTGIGSGKAREVFDLRTGASVAKFDAGEGRRITDQEYLSPDGKTWAFPALLGQEVKLIDTGTGKALPALAPAGSVHAAGFITPNRLLVIALKGRERVAQVFDTSTSKEVLTWPLDAGGFDIPGGYTRPFAVGPGGKYVAVVGAKAVAVHTVADGKKLADLDPPAVAAAPGKLVPPVGVAFAADGSELAAVIGKSDKGTGTLKVWKLADGTATEHPVDRPDTLPGSSAPAVSPILSGGWLIDGTLVWANGKAQRTVPKGMALYIPRLAVTAEQVVGVVEPPLTEFQKKPTVGVIAATSVASGPAKDGVLTGAQEVPTDERAGWTGAVNGFTPPFDPEPRQIDLKGKRAVGVTVPLDAKRILVETEVTPTVWRVAVFDLQNGTEVGGFNLPQHRVVFGEMVASGAVLTAGTGGAGAERLELYDTDGNSLGGWVPHPEVKPTGLRGSVRYAAAVSSTRVVTVGTGRVTLWQLPEAKAVWTTRIPDAAGGGLSPDGKVLFVPHAGGVRALNVETGGTHGNVKTDPLEHGGDDRAAVAVSGDGKRLATLSGPGIGRAIRVWDLSDGSLLTRRALTLDGDAGVFRFLGSRFLLVGESVIDLTDRREVWKVKPAGGVAAKVAPADGRVWFAFSGGGNTRLHAVAFPADHLARFITDYDKTGEGVFRNGEKVKVVIEPPADAPPTWDAQARTAARIGLAAAKLTEDAKATTVVTVKFSKAPDTPVKLKWQGAENLGKEETINRFALEVRTEVTRDGQVVYTGLPVRTEMRIKEWPLVNEITDDSKSGQEFFTKQVWNNAGASAGYVFTVTGSGIKQASGQMWRLPGDASLTKDGLFMNWPTGHQPVVGMAVEGDPSLTRPPEAKEEFGLPRGWVTAFVCVGLMVVVMVVVLVVALRWQRRRWDEAHPKRPSYYDEDDEDDRPRRRRRDD